MSAYHCQHRLLDGRELKVFVTEGNRTTEKNMRLFEGEIVAGHYRLDKYLDEGGFGAVYRATNLAFGLELRTVAIKLAKRPLSDEEARDIFGDAIKMTKLADDPLKNSVVNFLVW